MKNRRRSNPTPGAQVPPTWHRLSLCVRTLPHIHPVGFHVIPNEHRPRNLQLIESVIVFPFTSAWWSLIQNKPVQPQLTDGSNKLIKIHRFLNIGIRAEAVAIQAVLFLLRGGEDHNGEEPCPLVRTDA